MMAVRGMPSDWRERHPFKVGQLVHLKPGTPHGLRLGPMPVTVTMRGESERGLWIAVENFPYEFPVDEFVLTPITTINPGEAA